MSRPRADRWVTLEEVAKLAEKHRPKLRALQGKNRRQYARRLVQRVEKLHERRYTKRFGRELMVSVSALEHLLPWDATTITELEQSVAEIAQKQRDQQRQLNGHGARLRNLEEWRKLAGELLRGMSELEGVKVAS